jgi:hypothetical protein
VNWYLVTAGEMREEEKAIHLRYDGQAAACSRVHHDVARHKGEDGYVRRIGDADNVEEDPRHYPIVREFLEEFADAQDSCLIG